MRIPQFSGSGSRTAKLFVTLVLACGAVAFPTGNTYADVATPNALCEVDPKNISCFIELAVGETKSIVIALPNTDLSNLSAPVLLEMVATNSATLSGTDPEAHSNACWGTTTGKNAYGDPLYEYHVESAFSYNGENVLDDGASDYDNTWNGWTSYGHSPVKAHNPPPGPRVDQVGAITFGHCCFGSDHSHQIGIIERYNGVCSVHFRGNRT